MSPHSPDAPLARRGLFAAGAGPAPAGALPASGGRPRTPPTGGTTAAASGDLPSLSQWYHQYGEEGTKQAVERELREVELINQLVARTTEAIFEQVSGNVRVIGDRLLELHERGDQKGIAVVMRRFTQGTPGMKRLGVLTPEGRTLYLSAGQLPRESAPPTPAPTPYPDLGVFTEGGGQATPPPLLRGGERGLGLDPRVLRAFRPEGVDRPPPPTGGPGRCRPG